MRQEIDTAEVRAGETLFSLVRSLVREAAALDDLVDDVVTGMYEDDWGDSLDPVVLEQVARLLRTLALRAEHAGREVDCLAESARP